MRHPAYWSGGGLRGCPSPMTRNHACRIESASRETGMTDTQSKLTDEQREIARRILDRVRQDIADAAKGDPVIEFAVRRYVYVRLSHDERSTPMQRRSLKMRKFDQQGGSAQSAERRYNRSVTHTCIATTRSRATQRTTRTLCTQSAIANSRPHEDIPSHETRGHRPSAANQACPLATSWR